ncbi:amphiphysin isoform X2 [Scleropages formosus]|uniref:amphiphysin isoform X2 n=1 Tax=Scleropages formosus TaxID=113540 RepID=UPI0010FAA5C7|nr:amphiphysin isoform X2 [Scleropages formosus]
MAEIKTGIFAKNVQKRLSRAQEKVLQKLGKADETKDEQFEQCVQNFKRQETEGSRLQREMKAYLTAVKGMQQASMNLTESLHEVYEPDWYGKDDVMTIGKSCDALWEDFHQKLVDSSLITLDTYLAQFPDIKNRVAKRSRKLIDYDSARHHLETLQAGTIRNERKISKAEEEFQKAQKVFDELNVDLQEELPSLWESRVGFYVNTFKNITNLESKFHREIAMLCHKLYEVMTKLGEQHSDKMFTIQGAPSDSGPLRLARTPSPTEDESPPGSPEAAPNHTLRPTSPGPPRPKSPSQLKKGPPVPPPPKVTPTKELHQEQIINLFDDNFVPEISVTVPAQKESVAESLLDLDFDPFKPDATTPIGQTQSPISQTLPWDLWTTTAAPAQPLDSGPPFTADFDKMAEAEVEAAAAAPESEAAPESQVEATPAPEAEVTRSSEVAEGTEVTEVAEVTEVTEVSEVTETAETETGAEASPPAEKAAEAPEAQPSELPVSPESESAEIPPPGDGENEPSNEAAPDAAPTSEADKGSPPAEAPASAVPLEPPNEQTPSAEPALEDTNSTEGAEDSEAKEEKMPIPSVVIEPASSNEGDDDRDGDITSPSGVSDNGVTPESQTTAPGLPPGFLYKVEVLHDFEAANSDELDLKRGDLVLVVPTELAEDQDAGWLTGLKEADWLQQGSSAQKGLFPENFTQRLE